MELVIIEFRTGRMKAGPSASCLYRSNPSWRLSFCSWLRYTGWYSKAATLLSVIVQRRLKLKLNFSKALNYITDTRICQDQNSCKVDCLALSNALAHVYKLKLTPQQPCNAITKESTLKK